MPEGIRPSFAAGFPRHPELDTAVESFVEGNYARTRSESARILASNADEGVKRAARTLVARTEPDRLSLWLLALAALCLAAIAGWWTVHGKPPAPRHDGRASPANDRRPPEAR